MNEQKPKFAALVFFYTRYPNSQTLRSYFPDVNFDKSLTAQLVKVFNWNKNLTFIFRWNGSRTSGNNKIKFVRIGLKVIFITEFKYKAKFREFFYMQMEKYAKQALAEGVMESEEIQVVADSEIYRVG